MTTIDADAHVVECEETWNYFEAADREAMPLLVNLPSAGSLKTFWAIDGRFFSTGPVNETETAKAVRELADVDARLAQMDEIGTDIQVLYPTIFLRPLTTKPAIERALCRSYNRWIAERAAASGGRLRWAVIPPTMTMDAAIEEVRFGYENGANAVFWRGFENNRPPNHAYFAPLFEEIDRLGLAVCVHAANGSFDLIDVFGEPNGFWQFKIPGITSFQAILSSGMARKYPNIRFGFVELCAQWVPYVLNDYVRRSSVEGKEFDPKALMAENRLFVACQTDDDLAYIVSYAGTDNLVAGTDFGHRDTSSELRALQRLREVGAVAPEHLERILDDNPRVLYNL